ncbi:MAG TPA: hypothetical protein VIG24_03055 [Acidimicrobiia bacterium]
MSDDCACRHEGPVRGDLLPSFPEGAGLSLHCGGCGGWVEDSWLFTDGIPVTFTVETEQDYLGERLTNYHLEPADG